MESELWLDFVALGQKYQVELQSLRRFGQEQPIGRGSGYRTPAAGAARRRRPRPPSTRRQWRGQCRPRAC
jgi:hypothetical protein